MYKIHLNILHGRYLAFFTIFFFILFTPYISKANDTNQQPISIEAKIEKDINNKSSLLIQCKIKKNISLFPLALSQTNNIFNSFIQWEKSFSNNFFAWDQITQGGDTIKIDSLTCFKDTAWFRLPLHNLPNSDTIINGSFIWLAKNKNNYPSGQVNLSIKIPAKVSMFKMLKLMPIIKHQQLRTIFLLCFLAGLLAIITPCVFPIIPVTVSFFLKKNTSKRKAITHAFFYSFFIIIIYVVPTILLTMIFGDKILYNISVSPITNILFFIIFCLFAISFFGAFDIRLPSSWSTEADKQSERKGIIGIFFMALTLVIVSFSCTGPIVGTLLGQTTSTDHITLAPIIGMLGFGVGLALPFFLFALFPFMLKLLPKSGGWLNSVKIVFGFIELALSMKFLSNVDLIYHWHILNRDVFLTIWLSIMLLLSLYLIGKIKFAHDTSTHHISIPRLILAVFSFSFIFYLIPGLWGAPLSSLSGFIPPITTQEFNVTNTSIYESPNSETFPDSIKPHLYTNILKAPFGLQAYFDLSEGMKAANFFKKPIMLDFTGHSCANCRKMEEQVWSNPEVLSTIKNDFILISLYVDESTDLPADQIYTNKVGEKIATVGEKNLDYEINTFGFNAQPLYMFLDLHGSLLSDVKYGYDPSVNKFLNHLNDVKKKFEERIMR